MTIGPLFDRYPLEPGFKARGTSEDAAASMKPTAATLRDRALELFRHAHMTADELAAVLQVSVLTARPRVAELNALHLIEDTGERRPNASGRKAVVWRAVRG